MKNTGIRTITEVLSEQHYSPKTISKIYETSERTIRRLIILNNVKIVRVGRCIRIPESELQKIAVSIQLPSEKLDKWLIK